MYMLRTIHVCKMYSLKKWDCLVNSVWIYMYQEIFKGQDFHVYVWEI